MSAARRPLLAIALTVAALPLATPCSEAAAPGTVKVGVDRAKGVSFSIDGRMIDVTLRPADDGTTNPLVRELSGQSVVVACRGRSPKRGTWLVADLETAWPTDAPMLRGRLSRDASDDMQWCVLEQPDGTDTAVTRKLRMPKPAA